MGKSRRARQLMADKDAQLAALQARVEELSNTVATGNPTERRIFALAQAQVSREQEVRVCAAWLVGCTCSPNAELRPTPPVCCQGWPHPRAR